MGGYGSGRSGGRPTTENGLTLSLSKLLRDRLLRPGCVWGGSLVWRKINFASNTRPHARTHEAADRFCRAAVTLGMMIEPDYSKKSSSIFLISRVSSTRSGWSRCSGAPVQRVRPTGSAQVQPTSASARTSVSHPCPKALALQLPLSDNALRGDDGPTDCD